MLPKMLIDAVMFEDIYLAVEKESNGQRFRCSLFTGSCYWELFTALQSKRLQRWNEHDFLHL